MGENTNLNDSVFEDFQKLKELNILKNQSLYVDVSDDKFIQPNEIITELKAKEILKKAQMRLGATKPIFRPLDKIKETTDHLKEVLSNPEKVKEMNKKLNEQYGIEIID